MKWILLGSKISISLGLLTYLFWSVDITNLIGLITTAKGEPLVAALGVMFGGVVLSSYKWQILLKSDGLNCHFLELLRYYLIGIYFNNFLPTSIGGDAARAYLIARQHGQRLAAVTSIFTDRFSGMLAMILVGLVGISLVPNDVYGKEIKTVFWGLLLVSTFFIWFLNHRIRKLGNSIFLSTLLVHIERFSQPLRGYFSNWKTIWVLIWSSLLFQLLAILVYSLGAMAFKLDILFTEMMVVVPLVTMITLLPISFNGFGVREGGFVLLLSSLDVGREGALSLSLIIYGLNLLISAIGGILFLIFRWK